MSKARYYSSVGDFIEATRPGNISALAAQLQAHGSTLTGDAVELSKGSFKGEMGSWLSSLPALAEVLETAGLHKAWIALEYNPYQAGNGRADAVVMGSLGDVPSLVVVELKQWSSCTWDPELQRAVDLGAKWSDSAHPYRQARDYADFIAHYTDGFHPGQAHVAAAAFLHNASEDSIKSLRTAGADESAATFSGDATGRKRFADLLNAHLHHSDGQDTKSLLEHAKYKQGQGLLSAAGKMFQDPSAFPLTPEQREVVHKIQKHVLDTKSTYAKNDQAVIVVRGGPGSGKTWICTHLLGLMAQGGYQSAFATNSVALRDSLRRAARKLKGGVALSALITSARTYHEDKNVWGSLDLLVVDEAQRISEYTVRTGQRNRKDVQENLERHGITQLVELKKTAKVLVLMIDEQQRTTANDHVTIADAEALAADFGVPYIQLELTEQHRTGGSTNFEEWVRNLTHGTPSPWHDEANFVVEVADSPEDMEKRLQQLSGGHGHRIMAGFTWDWQQWPEGATGLSDVPMDIEIGDWRKHWNLRQSIDGQPKANDWATGDAGSDQVGSVFTAQGFEFPYCGVILGPDLVASDGRMEVSPDATRYRALRTRIKADETFAERIRNQYLVLLTRGMKGVVLYSTDPDTQALLKAHVNT